MCSYLPLSLFVMVRVKGQPIDANAVHEAQQEDETEQLKQRLSRMEENTRALEAQAECIIHINTLNQQMYDTIISREQTITRLEEELKKKSHIIEAQAICIKQMRNDATFDPVVAQLKDELNTKNGTIEAQFNLIKRINTQTNQYHTQIAQQRNELNEKENLLIAQSKRLLHLPST